MDCFPHEPGPSCKEWTISGALFVTTFLCTTFAGIIFGVLDVGYLSAFRSILHKPSLLVQGLPFSIPLLLILLAHELGHFFACRFYGMRCTPPYFIPLPISAGTLGAFIRIKSPFSHRRALFDVGVAGPLAGFVFILPILWIGISLSTLVPKATIPAGGISFGEPLIFRLFGALILGYSPSKQDIIAHPMAMAAWVGLLATSLNLLPIWQLDGGHIAYAICGHALQKKFSIGGIAVLLILSAFGWPIPSYLFLASLLLIIAARLRFYHPPPLFEEEALGHKRLLIGLLALIVLILSFIPVPVTIS